MKSTAKATITGIGLVLLTTFGGGVGIATIIAMPFGPLSSLFIGGSYIAASIVSWGAACSFGRKFFD